MHACISVVVVSNLLDKESRDDFIDEIREEYEEVREDHVSHTRHAVHTDDSCAIIT
jgi:cobalamin-dependent methionine synthase I